MALTIETSELGKRFIDSRRRDGQFIFCDSRGEGMAGCIESRTEGGRGANWKARKDNCKRQRIGWFVTGLGLTSGLESAIEFSFRFQDDFTNS
ncbi:hypothetical protein PoB_000683100 [Plakobranchus ocellatus]|uniref:Uncharacterized protein n=1 Tax=Plakobranchus ocellatus TaxID=259542 RepID=A0AAV3YAY1_9GAST|nr:hypothetical protein PoB_000683100 [Plakobranchus ocellatus]